MPRRFQHGDEHAGPISKTPGLNAFGQPQLDPYILNFGEHGSESAVSVGQNFDFDFQNSSHEFDQMYMQDIAPTAASDNAVWISTSSSTSLESVLSASITSGTSDMNDVDLAELTILGSHAIASAGNTITREQCIDYSTPVPHSTLDMSLHSEGDVLSTSNTDNIDMVANYNSYNIRKVRKRPADGMSDEANDSLIDKKDALKIILSVLPEPSMRIIMYLREQFGVRSDVMMDLCCQSVSSPEIRPFICDKPYRQDFDVSNIANQSTSVKFAEAEISPTTEIPNKLANSKHKKSWVAGAGALSQRYSCTKCDGSFTRRSDALRHLKGHAPAQLCCPDTRCHKVFSRKDKLNDHIRRMHRTVDHESTMPQMRDEESEDDPDDRTSLGKRASSSIKTLCGAFQGTTSAAGRVSCDKNSSTGGMSDTLPDVEVFCPISQKESPTSYINKFSQARIIRKLGDGGFGHVYELSASEDSCPDQESFACKLIQVPSQDGLQVIERAREEIRILRALDHPNIISFAGAIISKDSIMINTRPVTKCNLKEFLNQQLHPLSSTLKCQLWNGICGLASALSYLHGQGNGGACHGDIKPENILVIQDDEIKSWVRLLLTDFGSARLSITQTRTGVSTGTFTRRYCAPEWFKDHERGPSSDIWSFGCILTQVITYIYDRSMEDFDMFRVHTATANKYWTYHEYHQVVKNWLLTLPATCTEPSQQVLCTNRVALIFELLSLIPQERPSATEVAAKLQALSNSTVKVAPQEESALDISMKQPKDICKFRPCLSASWDTEVLNMIGLGQWSFGVTGISHKSGNTDLREATLILDTAGDPIHVLRWRSGIDGLESPWTFYSLQDVGSTDWSQKQQSAKTLRHLEEYTGDRMIPNLRRARTMTSPTSTVDIKPGNSQITGNEMGYQVPGEQHSQIRLVPTPRQLQRLDLKHLSSHSCVASSNKYRLIKPKPTDAHWTGVQRRGTLSTRFQISGEVRRKTYRRNSQPESQRFLSIYSSIPCRIYTDFILKNTVSFKYSLHCYSAILFPDFVYWRFQKSNIQDLLVKNIVSFTTNPVQVQMSCGVEYRPIGLTVHEFVPLFPELTRYNHIEIASSGESLKLVSSSTYTLPLGLYNVAEMDLRDTCLGYIKQNIIKERGIDELLDHDASVILRRAYKAVDRYRRETRNVRAHVLLEKAAILYGMQHFMSRVITITKASATEATRLLRDSKLVNDGGQYQFSKIISVQLKGVMYSLMKEITEELLTGLEREIIFTDKRQSSWARAFCIHVFLCVLTEGLQVAIDALILIKLGTSLYDASVLDKILRLDDFHEDLQKMFHRNYGTNSSSLSRKELKGFNPIRDGLILDIEKGWTQAEVDLINDIRGITLNNLEELEEKSANLSFKAEPNTLARHMAFRKRNSGRLVARFLRSFM